MSRHDLDVLLAEHEGLDPSGIATATRASAIGIPGTPIRLDSGRAVQRLRTVLRGARTFLGV